MSNQEAIALLRNLEDSLDSYCELSEEGKTAFRMAIEALSSSEFPNSSDTDTISRQQAIDVCRAPHMRNADCSDFEMAIMMLPPAQPERIKGHWVNGHCDKCNEHAPFWCMASTYHESNFCPNCGADMRREQNRMDDLISRKAVTDAIEKCHKQCCREDATGDEWIHYETALNEVQCIPPAEPKRMRATWISKVALQDGQITWIDYKCSNCSHHRGKPMNFCEVCGAKMEM